VRAISLALAGIFLGLSAIPPLAAAEGGLAVIAVISPPDQSLGETVNINVEVYRWGALADPESVRVRASDGSEVLVARTETGRYQGTVRLSPNLFAYGSTLNIAVDARQGNTTAYATASYALHSPLSTLPVGSGAYIRILNLDQIGWYPSPGETVNLEVRTYSDGALVDPSSVTGGCSVTFDQMNASNFEITFTRKDAGIFTGSLTVPSDLAGSAAYALSVFFRGNSNGTFTYGYGSAHFQVHPLPAVAWMDGVTATSAVVHVLAGDRAGPIGGATVVATASDASYGSPPTGSSPATGVTDAQGSANLSVNFPAGHATRVAVAVASGARRSTVDLFTRAPDPGPYYNWTPPGLSAKVVSDTSNYRPGDDAAITVHLENNGTPLYARRVTRIVYPDDRPGTAVAGNVTTDPTGNFTFLFRVPADWSPGAKLKVLVQAPEGDQALEVMFGGAPVSLSRRLTLATSYDADSRRIAVGANYSGPETLTGASAIAMLLPGADPFGFMYRTGGKPVFVALARSGSTFTGSLEVPAWMPLGNYTVLIGLTNGGATQLASDGVDAWNVSLVKVSAAPVKPHGNGPLFGGFVPGLDAAAAACAVAVVAGGTRALRRRKGG